MVLWMMVSSDEPSAYASLNCSTDSVSNIDKMPTKSRYSTASKVQIIAASLTGSSFPDIHIPDIDIWDLLFERTDRPFPDSKGELLLVSSLNKG